MARRKKEFDGERYTAFLGIQLTPTQRRAVETDAARSGRRLSDHVRARLLRGPNTPPPMGRDPKAIRALAAEVSRVGNNLNQLARAANRTGEIRSEAAIKAVSTRLADLFEKIIRL